VQAIEKRRTPGEGLRLMLKQLMAFPTPIRAWNPRTGVMEEKAKMEVFFDASIPELQYANYEGFAVGRGSKERILILLASLGYSYPTTAISEATDVARSTTSRLLWELRRDGLIEGGASRGAFVDSELWPYRYGPLRENYYMLTEEGAEAAGKLMTTRVIPLVPIGAVEKEVGEHPWVSRSEAERLVRDHAETMRRAKELWEKMGRGVQLDAEELRFLFGSEAFVEEEVSETPWGRAGRIAAETREKMKREG